MSDLKSVREAAEIVVRRVVEQLGDEKLNASRLIKSLASLTIDDVSEPDIGWENAKYHATRLALELGNAKNDSDKDRRYINRIWKDMVEAFEVIEPSIENDARKAGMRKILKPKKTDPKTGRVEFYLALQELDDCEASAPAASDQGVNHIVHYERVKNPKLTLTGKLFSRLVLHRPVHALLNMLPAAVLLGIGLFYEYTRRFEGDVPWGGFAIAILFFLFLFFLFRAFYSVETQRIVMAPLWMVKLRFNDYVQLRYQGSELKNKAGESVPEIVATIYEGECLVCGAKVNVDKGSEKFRGRLIGKCSNNPVEHIYSFDHVTQKGIPLRMDTYLGSLTTS